MHTNSGIDPAVPLASLRAAPTVVDGTQFNTLPQPGNIVNSIFSQSNAQGIQPIPTIQAQSTPLESFFANSGNLDALSKITKNLLNVGGDPGRVSRNSKEATLYLGIWASGYNG